MSRSRHRIGIVLPAFNEARALSVMLPQVAAELDRLELDWIGLVVDDGSLDATAQVASTLGWKCRRFVENRGFSSALMEGIRLMQATCDVVITMDADNTHDPCCIEGMLHAIGAGAGVVVASRYVPGAVVIGVPLHRRLVSRLANAMSQALWVGSGLRDFSSGYRAYASSALHSLRLVHASPLERAQHGFAITVELLFELLLAGADAREVPITLRYDRKPSASALRLWATLASGMGLALRYCGQRARQLISAGPPRTRATPTTELSVGG